MRTSPGWSRGRLQFKKGRIMRALPCWTHWNHRLFQVAIHLQLSYHVTLGFSRHVVSVLIIISSYEIEARWSWARWEGDDDADVYNLIPALDHSWINLCDLDKVLCHLFWANMAMYRVWALSPSCGRLPQVASNPMSSLFYIPHRSHWLDLGCD